MAKKSDATKLISNMFALRGSWEISDFRFHEATAGAVQKLIAQQAEAREFRKLDSVLLRTGQGFVGTNSTVGASADERRKTNIGQRDLAQLSSKADTLVVVGTIKLVPTFNRPERSDLPAYTEQLNQFCEKYIADGMLPGLIKRYLTNVVDGSILWRNQYGFDRTCVVTVRSTQPGSGTYVMKSASGLAFEQLVEACTAVAKLPQDGKNFLMLEVALAIELSPDAEVFPSQMFIDAEAKNALRDVPKKANYGRMLVSRADDNNDQQVCFSSQKIGNAFRRVDLGYAPGAETPIAIELYGAVTNQQVAHRASKNSFFDLVQVMNTDEISIEDRHFMMGVFMKGGLLNTGGKE
ncbi:type I-F CRISPR-associated protein Cas7f/Csy3 [Comamonas thiooxydans]|uniref:type I-F CRISPR-associated protein Cas7f/Csy3 n=1 Tax=Comamonas thiooxydans TaxID=363952 RepID=UPI000B41CEF0|nr:type I-F CRISPR-associated protein Cas7f/Csy3 [Comamonas thiooxydans]